jgi:UDPglucose 6-dehydrogenase
MKIAILGLGHVALSDALALGRTHDVTMTGPVPTRIEAIETGDFPLSDPQLADYVATHRPRVRATLDIGAALAGAGMILVSMPLSVDPGTGRIATAEIDSRIERALSECPGVPVVIRSAVPFGYCKGLLARHPEAPLVYAPEFLREGAPLSDLLAADFMIIGNTAPLGARVGRLLSQASMRDDVQIRQIGMREAEAVKHFSQAIVAARIGYFNELDSYALNHGLDARQIITGVCLDPRVGDHANNPCFGHGGRSAALSLGQMAELSAHEHMNILPAIMRAAEARVDFLASQIMARNPQRIVVIGGGGLQVGSLGQLGRRLKAIGADLESLDGNDGPLDERAANCDMIISQRMTAELAMLGTARVFSRDHFFVA